MIKPGNSKTWIDELQRAESLPAAYTATVVDYVATLAGRILKSHTFLGRPVIIGINGAQGSGKSTFALFVARWLQQELALRTVVLSLDDLYLGQQDRQALGRQHHPLLCTRGVPGTHDVSLGIELLDALTVTGAPRNLRLPSFDKAGDDQTRPSELCTVEVPVDVVLFEGWCVGAPPQPEEDLKDPVNELEEQEDAEGVWRSYANDQLGGDYARLFGRLDALIMLRVPALEKVLEWRELQEQKLRDKTSTNGMGPAELRRFVMHFERLTRHMLDVMPARANTVIDIDHRHRMVAMSHGHWPFEQAAP